VILLTPEPELQTAIGALNLGVHRYLVLPITPEDLESHVQQAITERPRALERDAAAGRLERRDAERLRLRAALARLWMAYQPIVETSSQAIFGFEALLRCDHAELSMPLPVIATARHVEATQEMGRQIRRAVTADADRLPPQASIFVNVLAEDLHDEELFDPRAPLSRIAHRVVFELTEQASLDAIPDVERRIQALRDLGFRIALDDLGAGYSGLSILARVHPEIVKLDRSLIHEVHRSERRQAVVGSMVDLCGALRISVIGEGVESADEAATLAQLGVPHLQGNLIARPDRLASLLLRANELRTNWNEAH
jgi:EAL domain-containing protein (putative c-di-GMP-specific phosphodiesterase class I)